MTREYFTGDSTKNVRIEHKKADLTPKKFKISTKKYKKRDMDIENR